MKYHHMEQYGRILRQLCYVKEIRKKDCVFYDSIYKKFQKIENNLQ